MTAMPPSGHKVCPELIDSIRTTQRRRQQIIKSRIAFTNRMVSMIAVDLGYHGDMTEAQREKFMNEAREIVRKVHEEGLDHPMKGLVESSLLGVAGFSENLDQFDKKLIASAKKLPVAPWVEEPEQKGFGIKSLGMIIGETGDLANYSNPGKVWRRLGLAPYDNGKKNLMGATWRGGKEGTLTNAQWIEFGYSPKRRSVMFIIGECLIKQRGTPYRARYDQAREKAIERHPEWIRCICDGTGKTATGKVCSNCKGKGTVTKRVHYHAMLLASKLLVKNLWKAWNPELAKVGEVY